MLEWQAADSVLHRWFGKLIESSIQL